MVQPCGSYIQKTTSLNFPKSTVISPSAVEVDGHKICLTGVPFRTWKYRIDVQSTSEKQYSPEETVIVPGIQRPSDDGSFGDTHEPAIHVYSFITLTSHMQTTRNYL